MTSQMTLAARPCRAAMLTAVFCLLVDISQAVGMCGCENRSGLLMDLYDATNGAQWKNKAGWGTINPCSTAWHGVTCGSGDITQVSLDSNSLSGTLPPSWSSLSSLWYLALHSNRLRGTLPPSWSALTSLQILYMHFNSLSGTLPPSWSAMSSLKEIHLYTNCLNGTVPATYSNLPNLQQMNLCNTNVTGGFHLITCVGNDSSVWPAYCKMARERGAETNSTSLTSQFTSSASASGTSGTSRMSIGLSVTAAACTSSSSSSSRSLTFSGLSSTDTTRSLRTKSLGLSHSRGGSTLSPSYSTTAATFSASPSYSTTTAISHASLSFGVMSTVSNVSSLTPTRSPAETTPTRPPISSSETATWMCTVAPDEVVLTLPPSESSAVRFNSRLVVIVSALGSFGAAESTVHGALASITTGPIERSVITAPPDLSFNLTIAAPASAARWTVAHVTMGGQRLNFTALSPSIARWHSVVVEPPPTQWGWLAPRTSPLVNRDVELWVVLSCGGEAVLTVGLTVPAPGIPRDFAERVVAATEYSQLASVLAGGATSGSVLGRTMATRSMVMCDADAAVGGGVLDLGLVICGAAVNGASVSARSAVISNLVLVGSVAAFLLLLTLLWAHLRGCSLADATQEFSLPSTLLPVCTVVLPSTSASAFLLAARLGSSPCTATDTLLAMCGAFLAALPSAALIATWRAQMCSARPAWVCVRREKLTSISTEDKNILMLLRGAFWRN